MGLYTEGGYVDIRFVLKQGQPFNLLIGGRGTGKTYGALTVALDDGLKIIYLRRSQTQADLIRTPEFSPYKAVNADRGMRIQTLTMTKYVSVITDTEADENGKSAAIGSPLGYVCALSTISNLRGFDMTDCDLLIYDEFIPERHERPLKNEAEAFFNAYETINRNRELQGKAPLRVLCLANSNQLASPILLYLGVARKLEKMQETGKQMSVDQQRGLALFNLCDSPISESKRNTALYKLTAGTTFERMSIDNKFMRETGKGISTRPLAEYKPVVAMGEICIYVHKSRPVFYVSGHVSGSPPMFEPTEAEADRFRMAYGYIWRAYLLGAVEFEDYFTEVLFTKYYNM